MFAVIQSVSKTRLHRAAHVSFRTIPSSLAAANDLPDKELRRIFAEASVLAEEERKMAETDEALHRWLIQQIGEHTLKVMAELLDYNAANLAKVVVGKRGISKKLRNRIGERMAGETGNLM
jgi:hypothetical protein